VQVKSVRSGVRDKTMEDSKRGKIGNEFRHMGDTLDSPCRNLNKWVYEGSHVLVFDIASRPLDFTSSCKDQGPKINGMDILPIINLLVRLLCFDK
jgi:hypothetical protein